jgi:hypothetical protein
MATYGIDKYVYVLANTAVELLGTSPTLRLDDSVIASDAELITYLGDLSGDTPLDTSATENIQFVGWSLSNTYSSSPASSTANVSSVVLSSLSFSDLSSSSVTNVYPVFQYYSTPSSAQQVDPGGSFDSGVAKADFYDSVEPTKNQAEENKVVNTALTNYPEPFLSGMKLEGGIQLWNPATETGLTLNTIDSNNVVWVVTDIAGWWTLPDPELPDLPRGWGDGSYDAIGRYANRILTLNGSFLPQEPSDAAAARNTLMSYLSPMVKTTTAGYLIVDENESYDISSRVIASDAEISNAVGDGTNVVYTTQESIHSFSVGDSITVANTSPSAFDVAGQEIIAITSNTFTVASSVTDTYVSGGTATHPYAKYTTSTNHNIAVGDYLAIPNGADIEVVAVTSNTVTIDGVVGVEAIKSNKLVHKIRKAAKVRLSGAPQITSVNARGRHDFSIGLKAVDPIKYEFVDGDPDGYQTATINSSSSWETTIVNDGNTAVPVIIEISGVSAVTDSDNPPTITNQENGQSIELVGGVASGHKLEVDTYNREALDVTYSAGAVTNTANGRAKLQVLVDWIYLEPGSNRLYVSNYTENSITSSEWVIYYRSGWIG